MYQFIVKHTDRPSRLGNQFYGNCGDREIGFTTSGMIVDGKEVFAISGEVHFSRVRESRWKRVLMQMKSGGINIVSTYVFWNHHEETPGQFDFSGQKNLKRFLQAAQEVGLYIILRVGPFCHGEVRNGGLPDWLYGMPFEVRSINDGFMFYVERLFRQIAIQTEGLLYKDGGPIIGIQLENEYMHSAAMWEHTRATTAEYANSGDDGDAYLLYLKKLLKRVGLDTPFYTCTAWGGAATPYQEALPLWGGYPYAPWLITKETPIHPLTEEYLYRDCRNPHGARYHSYDPIYDPRTMPFACCEMGPSMQTAYAYRFICDPRAADALANVKTGSGCNFLGYYVYAGGTNPRGNVFPYMHEEWCPKLSYDYQAPIGEYGQIRENYRRLRTIHTTLQSFAEELACMEPFLPDRAACTPDDRSTLRCAVRSDGEKGFLFLNAFQDHAELSEFVNERVIVYAGERKIEFPTIALAPGENCILPFALPILGGEIVSATVQILKCIECEGGMNMHAMIPDGMTPCVCFADGRTWKPKPSERQWRIELPEGMLTICLYDRQTASGLYFTDDDVYCCNGGVIWADEHGPVAEAIGTDMRIVSTKETWDVPCPSIRQTIEAKPVCKGKWRLNLPDLSLEDEICDGMIRIDYDGDIAQLFDENGTLIADDFCNGNPWEISLCELKERMGGKTALTLVIVPRKEGTEVVRDAMAAITEKVGRSVVHLERIQMLPWIRVRLNKAR